MPAYMHSIFYIKTKCRKESIRLYNLAEISNTTNFGVRQLFWFQKNVSVYMLVEEKYITKVVI